MLSTDWIINTMNHEVNWYIEYDNKTFSILHKPKYEKYAFRAAQLFADSSVHELSENI